MDKKQQVEKLIKFLEHMKKRPGVYVHEQEATISKFFAGFDAACTLFGFYDGLGELPIADAMIACGWENTLRKTYYQMEIQELGEDEITQETLKFYADAWKRLYEQML